MELIRRGADRIVTVSEIWFKDDDGVATWEGVMVMEATPAGETLHIASFEGRNTLGLWETCPGGPQWQPVSAVRKGSGRDVEYHTSAAVIKPTRIDRHRIEKKCFGTTLRNGCMMVELLRNTGKKADKGRNQIWECRCPVCGRIFETRKSDAKKMKSCNCAMRKKSIVWYRDYTGCWINNLEVLEFLGIENKLSRFR